MGSTGTADSGTINQVMPRRPLKPYAASFCTQFAAVAGVQWLYKVRDIAVVRTRMFTYLFFGILVGSMYVSLSIDAMVLTISRFMVMCFLG